MYPLRKVKKKPSHLTLDVVLGRKGIEPSMDKTIEFTAQPANQRTDPSLKTSYIGVEPIKKILIKMLNFITPVQFPLHEPYFDLTPIRVIHTKPKLYIYIPNYIYLNIG